MPTSKTKNKLPKKIALFAGAGMLFRTKTADCAVVATQTTPQCENVTIMTLQNTLPKADTFFSKGQPPPG